MKMRIARFPLIVAHAILAALIAAVLLLPKGRAAVHSPGALLSALAVIEGLFLLHLAHRRRSGRPVTGDILLLVWLLLLCWELVTSVLDLTNPVLVPCPENVFDTFRIQWRRMLANVWYSLRLLTVGFVTGLVLAVLAGLAVGWKTRLREFITPIANVMAPIPAIVFSPYLVAVMPSFRSASALVIVLGLFWPTLLTTVNRVGSVDRRLLDSARMLELGDRALIFRILLPSVLPGIVSGLNVSVTTSVLMLNFAELMGATHGMGYYIQNSITYANYTQAVAGILCIGTVVTVLNRLVTFIQKHAIRWR